MDAFIAKLANPGKVLRIGKGAAGTVYLDSDQPNVVFKVSNKNDTCRKFDKEYTIYQEVNKHNIDTDLVKILRMNEFRLRDNNTSCVMELTRVVNPLDPAADYTIQTEFGEDDFDYKDADRGYILGLQQLIGKGIVSKETLSTYMQQLGTVVGRLHYVAKNDGYDLEVYAGKQNGTLILYIGDFDLSNMITDYNKDVVKNMVWSLAAIPYFPTKDQPELLAVFRDAYTAVATSAGQGDVAKDVMDQYSEV